MWPAQSLLREPDPIEVSPSTLCSNFRASFLYNTFHVRSPSRQVTTTHHLPSPQHPWGQFTHHPDPIGALPAPWHATAAKGNLKHESELTELQRCFLYETFRLVQISVVKYACSAHCAGGWLKARPSYRYHCVTNARNRPLALFQLW